MRFIDVLLLEEVGLNLVALHCLKFPEEVDEGALERLRHFDV